VVDELTSAAESLEPVHAWTFQAREPGDPISFSIALWRITVVESACGQKIETKRKFGGNLVLDDLDWRNVG